MIDSLSRQIIDRYQKGLPLCRHPFQAIADELGATEAEVIHCIQQLQANKVITRIGPVFNHHKAGASTLAALAVPHERLQEIAHYVNQFDGVNHNYAREHDYNLWFVATAPTQEKLNAILDAIKQTTSMPLLILPMEQAYHIDLSFKLTWQDSE